MYCIIIYTKLCGQVSMLNGRFYKKATEPSYWGFLVNIFIKADAAVLIKTFRVSEGKHSCRGTHCTASLVQMQLKSSVY